MQQRASLYDLLDMIMQGAFGDWNHGYIMLAFENFFKEDTSEACNANLERFAEDFCTRSYRVECLRNSDQQAVIYFRMLKRLFGKQQILSFVSEVSMGGTLVHKAAQTGLYSLIDEVIVDELGFDLDFWLPASRQTIVNTIVKNRRHLWSEEEKVIISRMIEKS